MPRSRPATGANASPIRALISTAPTSPTTGGRPSATSSGVVLGVAGEHRVADRADQQEERVRERELPGLPDEQREPDPADDADQDVLGELEVGHLGADEHRQQEQHDQQHEPSRRS